MDFSRYRHMRVMVWAAFAMALPLAAARAQTFPAVPVNLSGTGSALVPSIAVGPSGDINVTWLDSGAIHFRRSPGGGTNFSGAMVVATTNLPSQSSQPQIAVNSAGVYVAWAGTNGSGLGDIFVSTLASGTNSWTPPVNVSNGRGIASGSSAPVPRIAVDPSGGVDVVWGQNAAYFARSTNQGNSFTTVTPPLSSSPMQRVSPRIAVGAQGSIDVVWVEADPNFPNCTGPTIKFARSTNEGTSFTTYSVADNLTVNTQPITGCASDVQIAADASNNTIHLLWANENVQIQDLITTYATDTDPFTGSGSTSFPETNFQNLSTTASRTPQMAIDSNGNIDVVWSGDFKQNGGPPAIYFTRATDGGKNFATPLPLTNPPASGAKATGFPQIAAEPTGAIDVLWQQASAANPNNAYDIVLARSTDGVSFKQFTPDNSPTVTGNTGQVAVDGSGNAYVVWLGNSGSSADVFLSGDSMALTNAGFNLTISASGPAVLPGATVTYNVVVNSTGGFNQSVTLSCSSLPLGVACSFSPPTVTLSTSAATSTLTVSLPPTITAGTYSVGVTGTGGGLAQAVSTQFVVSGLTASITPASATISVGGSASFTILLSATNGFAGPVTLACLGAPAGVSCNSPSVMVPGSAMLNVSVSAKPSAAAVQRWPRARPSSPLARPPVITGWMWAIIFVIFLATLITRKREVVSTLMQTPRPVGLKTLSFARPLVLVLLLAAATALVSCSGSTSSGGGGGGSITFPLTIQAKSSSATTNLQTISITVP